MAFDFDRLILVDLLDLDFLFRAQPREISLLVGSDHELVGRPAVFSLLTGNLRGVLGLLDGDRRLPLDTAQLQLCFRLNDDFFNLTFRLLVLCSTFCWVWKRSSWIAFVSLHGCDIDLQVGSYLRLLGLLPPDGFLGGNVGCLFGPPNCDLSLLLSLAYSSCFAISSFRVSVSRFFC